MGIHDSNAKLLCHRDSLGTKHEEQELICNVTGINILGFKNMVCFFFKKDLDVVGTLLLYLSYGFQKTKTESSLHLDRPRLELRVEWIRP